MKKLSLIAARNSIYSACGKFSVKVISFVFTIFIIRWLGDAAYGQYVIVWSYVTVFAMLSDAGLSTYAVREIAKKAPGSQYIAGNIIALRIMLAASTMFLIVTSAWLFGYSQQFLWYVFLAAAILPLYAVQDPLDATLQAQERFDLAAIAIIAGQLVFVGFGLIFLFLEWHITGLIVAGLLNVFVSALLAWYLMRYTQSNLQWRIRPSQWWCFLKISFPFGLIKLWSTWALKIDIIILSLFWFEQMAGWYGAAYAIVIGVLMVSSSINGALYPTLSRQFAEEAVKLPTIYEIFLKYLLLLSLPVAGGVFLTSDKWVAMLYGSDFAPAALALSILIWTVPLIFVSEFFRYSLLATNREHLVVKGLGGVILLNILLNIWWIPLYGFLAAAIITVVSELLLLLFYVWYLHSDIKPIALSQVVFAPLSATAILMIVLYFLSTTSLVGQIVIGGIVYTSLILLFRVIKPMDYQLLFNSNKRDRETTSVLSVEIGNKLLPKISVFIPAYNAGPFVAQAIESVLAQSYSNYELIVIDDGSTDNTIKVLEKYQSHQKVKIYQNKKNMGMAPTWNIGLKLCRGELIAKLDADDFYEPTFLETMVGFSQNHQQVGLIFSGVKLLYPDGRSEPEMSSMRSWVREPQDFLPTLLQLCIIRSPSVCVRRDCYKKLGGFIEDMYIHADWEMWVRIAANYPVGFIAHRLANYRMSYSFNVTAQAAFDGRSMHDLKLWLDLLDQNQLPYQLTKDEEEKLRWGMYELEMHFAATAAYHQQEAMQTAYTLFAEGILPEQVPDSEKEKMRKVYTYLHQGICAFRDRKMKEARRFFLQAIKTDPTYCKPLWIWSKLLLTFIGRTKWGFLYK